LFVASLLPAFLVFAWYYCSCDRVAVPYRTDGTSRHFVDIYGSARTHRSSSSEEKGGNGEVENKSKPVVIFLTGGAWIIGYKMWGALLARALVPFGVVVAIPDYRNFPGVSISGMINDVDDSIQWVFDNCHNYCGDPDRVVLVGQSAGAHLGSCIMILKALAELGRGKSSDHSLLSEYKARDIKGFISTSGPYNLVNMKETFHQHGLDKNIVSAIFGQAVEQYSPTHLLLRCQQIMEAERGDTLAHGSLSEIVPPIHVIHGTRDKTVPYREAVEFVSCLRDARADVVQHLYAGWSHTDPILEGPMDGDQTYHQEIYDLVKKWTKINGDEMAPFDQTIPECRRICPRCLVSMGRFFNPF